MKMMGTSRLKDLAMSGVEGVSGAVAALCAELAFASWTSPEDVAEHYPAALVERGLIRIPIGERHCVDLIANYDRGMILVEFAGMIENTRSMIKIKGKNAA